MPFIIIMISYEIIDFSSAIYSMQVLRLMRQLENLRTGDLITEFCDLFVVNPFDRWVTCALTEIERCSV